MGSMCSAGDAVGAERDEVTNAQSLHLQRESGKPVGLDLDFMDGKTARVLEILDGAARSARVGIKPGDHIISVNGSRSVGEMMKHLKDDTSLDIEVTRPKEFRVTVQKTDALGIDYTHAPKGDCLLIRSVLSSGAMQRWNEAHPASAVKPLDRIVEANGFRGSWSKLFATIQGSEDLALALAPCPAQPNPKAAAVREPSDLPAAA
mmetsp:Transcript_15181/g.47722  ORF Transcript_15181/g.47722 Transcript_15181/m.47722 type:complete len:205 (+) Transcript_15181:106-720(+)